MTETTQAEPVRWADIDKAHHATRMRVLGALPRNGDPMRDTAIARECGLMLGATLMHLRTLERLHAVCGRGEWWHRTGGEQ